VFASNFIILCAVTLIDRTNSCCVVQLVYGFGTWATVNGCHTMIVTEFLRGRTGPPTTPLTVILIDKDVRI
jgi:hypothetical protein